MKNPIDGYSNLYKDEESGVIHNRSSSERDRYRIAKRNSLAHVEQKAELDELRDEMSEIKSLLKQLIQNNDT